MFKVNNKGTERRHSRLGRNSVVCFVIIMRNEISKITKGNYIKIKCLSLPVDLKPLIRLCIYLQRTVIFCYESIGHT